MQSQFSETDLEAKHKWIYAVVPLSVGPVGPGGGIYSSIEDVHKSEKLYIYHVLQYVLFIIRLRLNQHLPIAMGKCRLWVNVSWVNVSSIFA